MEQVINSILPCCPTANVRFPPASKDTCVLFRYLPSFPTRSRNYPCQRKERKARERARQRREREREIKKKSRYRDSLDSDGGLCCVVVNLDERSPLPKSHPPGPLKQARCWQDISQFLFFEPRNRDGHGSKLHRIR